MREGYTPAAHAFPLCRAHAQRPTLGLDGRPTKLSHLHRALRRSDTRIESYKPREIYTGRAVLLGENQHRLRPGPLTQLGPIVLDKKSWNFRDD